MISGFELQSGGRLAAWGEWVAQKIQQAAPQGQESPNQERLSQAPLSQALHNQALHNQGLHNQGLPSPGLYGQPPTAQLSWAAGVAYIGQEIRTLRQAQALTLEEIHLTTKVPLYHLRSIEAGEVEKLPDAVFVHGFLQKICRALGAETLLEQLPEAQTVQQQRMLMRQTHSAGSGAAHLSVAHLYIGYGVLLAGALGGLLGGLTEAGPNAPSEDQRLLSKPESTQVSFLAGSPAPSSRRVGVGMRAGESKTAV